LSEEGGKVTLLKGEFTQERGDNKTSFFDSYFEREISWNNPQIGDIAEFCHTIKDAVRLASGSKKPYEINIKVYE